MSDRIKFGIKSNKGYAVYLNHGDCFLKCFDISKDGFYTDGGVTYETYTNKYFLEMESLSESQTIPPSGSVEHTELCSLYKTHMAKKEL